MKSIAGALAMLLLSVGLTSLIFGVILFFQPDKSSNWMSPQQASLYLVIPAIVMLALAFLFDNFSDKA